jgi:hypothetical protein
MDEGSGTAAFTGGTYRLLKMNEPGALAVTPAGRLKRSMPVGKSRLLA